MTLTADFSQLSRQQLIDRIIELEMLMTPEAETMAALPFHLPIMEKLILGTLLEANGRKLSYDYLCETSGCSSWKALKVHISRIRKVLESQDPSMSVESSNGQGYWLGPNTLTNLKELLHVRPNERLAYRLGPISRARLLRRNPNHSLGPAVGASSEGE